MRKIIVILVLVFFNISCVTTEPKPYEATWLKITETYKGYVVYNYLSLWDEKTIAPTSITVRNDSLIWLTYSDDVGRYSLKKVNIEERENESYFFPVGNLFLFTWYDKENHIAQWKIYDIAERLKNDNPRTYYLYIDSRYNTFPVIDYEWGEWSEGWDD